MYKCELCGEQSFPGEKQVKVVLEHYPEGSTRYGLVEHESHDKSGFVTDRWLCFEEVGTWESRQIKREINAHPACASLHAAGKWDGLSKELMARGRKLVKMLLPGREALDRLLAMKGDAP